MVCRRPVGQWNPTNVRGKSCPLNVQVTECTRPDTVIFPPRQFLSSAVSQPGVVRPLVCWPEPFCFVRNCSSD
uniref:Uncharacterized protein n=1 Tax=Hyaloperonospora arabidopsidis (strain Emoy2) TaxID=559515 RepID=M4BIX5_HYAAE